MSQISRPWGTANLSFNTAHKLRTDQDQNHHSSQSHVDSAVQRFCVLLCDSQRIKIKATHNCHFLGKFLNMLNNFTPSHWGFLCSCWNSTLSCTIQTDSSHPQQELHTAFPTTESQLPTLDPGMEATHKHTDQRLNSRWIRRRGKFPTSLLPDLAVLLGCQIWLPPKGTGTGCAALWVGVLQCSYGETPPEAACSLPVPCVQQWLPGHLPGQGSFCLSDTN